MNLFLDWTASTATERTVNAVLRLFGWDCYIDRHGLSEWQWGWDSPQASLAAHVGGGKVVALPGVAPHLQHDVWVGPFQITIGRI